VKKGFERCILLRDFSRGSQDLNRSPKNAKDRVLTNYSGIGEVILKKAFPVFTTIFARMAKNQPGP
jgi:hypothetical protein